MDKTAQRQKAKRRAERAAELQAAKAAAYAGLKDFAKSSGVKTDRVKRAGTEKVWAAHLAVEKEFFTQSAVIANLAILHTLAFEFNYGRTERLPKAFKSAVKGLQTVSKNERSAAQFADEMAGQFNFDFVKFINGFFDKFDDELLMRIGVSPAHSATMVGLAERVPSLLIIGLYSCYFWLGFKKPSMLKLARQSAKAAADMIRNQKFYAYQQELLKKTDINFTDTGLVIFRYSDCLKGEK